MPVPDDFQLVFADEFTGRDIDPARWVVSYLPHWSSRAQSRPCYTMADSILSFSIEADQKPWCPDLDGPTLASCIQTGLFSGPLGSDIGQLQFNPRCRVTEELEDQVTLLFQYGYVEARMRSIRNPLNMGALWTIGYEDVPERSGEICIAELKGWLMDETSLTVGYGVHPWQDPTLHDDFHEDRLPLDPSEFHTIAIDWRPDGIDYLVDDMVIGRTTESPAYPQQLILGLYEFPREDGSRDPADAYPKQFEVDYIRIWQREPNATGTGVLG